MWVQPTEWQRFAWMGRTHPTTVNPAFWNIHSGPTKRQMCQTLRSNPGMSRFEVRVGTRRDAAVRKSVRPGEIGEGGPLI
jgi:hypothetical protein